jgi:surface protein
MSSNVGNVGGDAGGCVVNTNSNSVAVMKHTSTTATARTSVMNAMQGSSTKPTVGKDGCSQPSESSTIAEAGSIVDTRIAAATQNDAHLSNSTEFTEFTCKALGLRGDKGWNRTTKLDSVTIDNRGGSRSMVSNHGSAATRKPAVNVESRLDGDQNCHVDNDSGPAPPAQGDLHSDRTSEADAAIMSNNLEQDQVVHSPLISNPNTLPDYKDQVRGRSDSDQRSVLAQVEATNDSPAAVVGDLNSMPDYKDQMRSEATRGSQPSTRANAIEGHNIAPNTAVGGNLKQLMQTNSANQNEEHDGPLTGSENVHHERFPNYKDQANPRGDGSTNQNVEQDMKPEMGDLTLSRVDWVSAASDQEAVVVFVNRAVDERSFGGAMAEGIGVMVDEIYDSVDASGEQSDSVEPKLRWSRFLVFGTVIVLAVLAVTAGTFCGLNECRPGARPNGYEAFEDAETLRNVVGTYIGAAYYNSTSSASVLANLTEKYGPISQWDVSRVTDFSLVFYRGDRPGYRTAGDDLTTFDPKENLFNEDISGWDVSSATTMEGMFAGATKFNQSLSAWDTSRVTNMRAMFHSAHDFDQDLGGWNVGSVEDFSGMFTDSVRFRGVGLSQWDTSRCTDMRNMVRLLFVFLARFRFRCRLMPSRSICISLREPMSLIVTYPLGTLRE